MLVNLVKLLDSLDHMIRCLSYLNSMCEIANKLYKILVHTTTFNIIVFNQQKYKKVGAALVITITSNIVNILIAPAGFWPRGQNPRRHHRSPRVNSNMICGEYRLYTG